MNLYLLINILVIIFPLLLSFDKRVAFYRQQKAALPAILAVAVLFIAQDIHATAQGHWNFSPEYAGSFKIFGLPPGEWLFFITVPFACVFIYACVRAYRREKTVTFPRSLNLAVAALAISGAIVFRSLEYTAWAMVLFALPWLLFFFLRPDLPRSLSFWTALAITYIAFAMVNGVLTALPVVTYSSSDIWGIRAGTIPLEDFLYSFSLISLNYILFRLFLDRKRRPSPDEGMYSGPGGTGSVALPQAPYSFLAKRATKGR